MIKRVVRGWWPLAAVAVLLVAAGLSAAHATPQLDRIARDGPNGPHPTLEAPEAQNSMPPDVQHPGAGVHLPSWLPVLLYTVLLALALTVVALVVRSVVGRMRGGDTGEDADDGRVGDRRRPSDAEVLAAVEAGLAELSDSDSDPRRAVIACWLRLEEAAEAAGVPRYPADTATDLVVRLLSGAEPGAAPAPAVPASVAPAPAVPAPAVPAPAAPASAALDGGGPEGDHAGAGALPAGKARVASAGVLARFAEIYLAARYATHPVGEQAREQARSALHTLRAELTAGAAR